MPGIKTKQGLFFKATSLLSHELNIGGNFYNPFNLSLTLFPSKNICTSCWHIQDQNPYEFILNTQSRKSGFGVMSV